MKKPIYKILINWYQASDKELPAWLERACENDPSLSQERQFGDELTRALQKRPNDSTPFEGASMASRVLRQITEEDYLAEREQGESAPVWGAWVRNLGMAAAALAVALVGYQYLDTKSVVDGDGGTVAIVENDMSTDGLLEVATDWKNPLDQEIEYIVSDAKGALGFLASTFVPSSYLKDEDNA